MTGTVSFTFQTFEGKIGSPYAGDAGGPDETWILGNATVTPTTGGGATATLTTEIPPGLYGTANVVAMYNGDTKYLASVSPQVPVTVTGSTLAITPTSITLAPGQATTFNTTGGVPPILWATLSPDTTCVVDTTAMTENCSQIESETTTEGYFQAGPQPGTVNVTATDTQGQEVSLTVTVTGTPVDGGAFPMFDSGPTGGPGNGPATGGTTADSGTGHGHRRRLGRGHPRRRRR